METEQGEMPGPTLREGKYDWKRSVIELVRPCCPSSQNAGRGCNSRQMHALALFTLPGVHYNAMTGDAY